MRSVVWLALMVACSGGDGNTVTDDVPPTDGDPPVDDTGETTLPPTGDCVASVTDVAVLDNPGSILTKTLQVTLDGSAPAWAACTAAGDPSQVVLAEATTSAGSHELLIAGLYANETWSCEVATTCEGATAATAEIVTAELPSSLHLGTVSRNPSLEPAGEWTLFNSGVLLCGGDPTQYLQIVDTEGRVRWGHVVGTDYVIDIDAEWTGDRIHYGGGWGLFEPSAPTRGIIRQIDLAGNVLLAIDGPQFGQGYNHHSEVLADGSILSLTTPLNTSGASSWDGIGYEVLDPTGTAVIETWDSQLLVDAGIESQQQGNPWHNNSVTFVTDSLGDAAYISALFSEEIWRIDRATGERTHVIGKTGNVTFVDSSGAPLAAEDATYGQHDPDYVDDRVLVYDNGSGRPGYFGGKSRVAEFQVDLTAGTAALVWEWTEDPWYTPIIGDADYLDDNHVLVTKGNVNCITGWLDQTSGLIEVDQVTGQPAWRYDMQEQNVAIYRSQRYDGCEIFSNAAACPAVADRIATLRALLAR